MGVLDDAIREHLELKRRHGATEDEVQRQEEEALGPARRDVAQQHEEAADATAIAQEDGLFDGEEPSAAHDPAPGGGGGCPGGGAPAAAPEGQGFPRAPRVGGRAARGRDPRALREPIAEEPIAAEPTPVEPPPVDPPPAAELHPAEEPP